MAATATHVAFSPEYQSGELNFEEIANPQAILGLVDDWTVYTTLSGSMRRNLRHMISKISNTLTTPATFSRTGFLCLLASRQANLILCNDGFVYRIDRFAMFCRGSSRAPAIGFCVCVAIACAIFFSAVPASMAQVSAARKMLNEDRVKATSIYRFLDYVEWPQPVFARADSPYVISIVNADTIADEVSKLAAGRNPQSRPVTVRRLQVGDPIEQTHVLFIGGPVKTWQIQLLKQTQGQPILLVTDFDNALSQGSMINFQVVNERVRFEIALEPVEKSGLAISTRMLTVAMSVIKDTPK